MGVVKNGDFHCFWSLSVWNLQRYEAKNYKILLTVRGAASATEMGHKQADKLP